MVTTRHIRPLTATDFAAVKMVIDATELFPSEILDEMVGDALDDTDSEHHWLTCDAGGPVAVAYYAPEQMTDGTWNLYLIAVHPDQQGKGIGAALMAHVENALAEQGQRVLLVETSGNSEFERTRAFYRHLGYEEEARIREFYSAGEDKVVFRKSLAQPS